MRLLSILWQSSRSRKSMEPYTSKERRARSKPTEEHQTSNVLLRDKTKWSSLEGKQASHYNHTLPPDEIMKSDLGLPS